MSGIAIHIPLDALPSDVNLDPRAIVNHIKDSEKHRLAAEQWKARYNEVATTLAGAGMELQRLLYEDAALSEFDKLRTLREFVESLKVAGTQYMKAE